MIKFIKDLFEPKPKYRLRPTHTGRYAMDVYEYEPALMAHRYRFLELFVSIDEADQAIKYLERETIYYREKSK